VLLITLMAVAPATLLAFYGSRFVVADQLSAESALP
jgi:hypothetical protein